LIYPYLPIFTHIYPYLPIKNGDFQYKSQFFHGFPMLFPLKMVIFPPWIYDLPPEISGAPHRLPSVGSARALAGAPTSAPAQGSSGRMPQKQVIFSIFGEWILFRPRI
jgi:hypothetical protein